MTALWESFESWLRQRFPETRTIATPFSDPLFSTEEYQAFLRGLFAYPESSVWENLITPGAQARLGHPT